MRLFVENNLFAWLISDDQFIITILFKRTSWRWRRENEISLIVV